MELRIWQIDAFCRGVFTGNPAAVVPLETWPGDDVLQAIAAENNLSETAYLVPEADGWELRWFTPAIEVALCGHATLASAHAVATGIAPGRTGMRFRTRTSGVLTVRAEGDGYVMDFPALPPFPCTAPEGLADALGAAPVEVLEAEYAPGDRDLVVVLADQAAVASLVPDLAWIRGLGTRGLIATARGEACDIVSRYFAPAAGIDEDPVTGAAHCVVTPYWAGVLGRDTLAAEQLSARHGWIGCRLAGDRVMLRGQAATYLEGTIRI